MISPLRFAYENACRADTKGNSTAGAYVGYSAIRRGWIPSTWVRLHGLREADSLKFDFARAKGAKALPKWRYQSKDLTRIILKLSTPSSWEESMFSCYEETTSLQVLDSNTGSGLPGLLGGDASPAFALFCTLGVQPLLSNTRCWHTLLFPAAKVLNSAQRVLNNICFHRY